MLYLPSFQEYEKIIPIIQKTLRNGVGIFVMLNQKKQWMFSKFIPSCFMTETLNSDFNEIMKLYIV